MSDKDLQRTKMASAPGFIAALDQSGGSTPKALGLYGVLAFFVARRVHEIGIRVALGASGGNVMGLVVTRGMVLVAVGSVLGIAGAVAATRLVEEMLFQVTATDPATYAGVTGLFLVVALGACVLPAWRALRIDPVDAFRTE